MVHTTQIIARTAANPAAAWYKDDRSVVALDVPGVTVYLSREQAVQLATALLTGFMQAIPDVAYIDG